LERLNLKRTIKYSFKQELNAVGFVVQSALARLTASQKYIFNSVLAIFGKDIGENVRFLVTFADGDQPPVLEAIKEAKLPCLMDSSGLPCHQSFNNCAVYKSKTSANTKRLRYHWEDGIENFKTFFDEISDMPTKSLQMTKEVLDLKKHLEIQLDFMHRDINKQLMKMEELRKTEEIIALNRDKVDANKNFEVKVPVSKKAKVHVGGQNALNCTTCQVTCHYPCNPGLWSGFCPAFWRSENIVPNMAGAINVFQSMTKLRSEPIRVLSAVVDTVKNSASNLVSPTCKVCPGNCPSSDHTNEDSKWDFVQQEETRTMDDVRQKYQEAMGQQLSAEGILNGLQNEVEQLKSDIVKTMAEITRCSNVLREKALRGNPLSTLEYIQMIIDDERNDEKPGYEERIKSLEDVLERARLTQGTVVGRE
jgi:hypothetical protein